MERETLQPRLRLLAELVPYGARLADVGTDHGYIPVCLLREGWISHAIASDIHSEPLAHARNTASQYGVAEKIDFRLCDGLREIRPDEADTILIAGMGGDMIVSILDEAPWTRNGNVSLILQPMTKTEMLRVWLADNGYTFTDERLVQDKGFLYPVLCAVGGQHAPLSPEQAYGGVMLENDPLWGTYLTRQLQRLEQRMEGLGRARDEAAAQEIKQLAALCRALEEKRSEQK